MFACCEQQTHTHTLTQTHTHTHTHKNTLFSPPPSHSGLAWVTAVAASWARKKGALIKIRARNSLWSTSNNNNNNKGQKTLAQMSLLFGHFGEVSAVQKGGRGEVCRGNVWGNACRNSLYALQMPSSVFRPFYVLGLLLIFTVLSSLHSPLPRAFPLVACPVSSALLPLFFLFFSFFCADFCLPLPRWTQKLTGLVCHLCESPTAPPPSHSDVVVLQHSNEVYPQQLFSKRALACVKAIFCQRAHKSRQRFAKRLTERVRGRRGEREGALSDRGDRVGVTQ